MDCTKYNENGRLWMLRGIPLSGGAKVVNHTSNTVIIDSDPFLFV